LFNVKLSWKILLLGNKNFWIHTGASLAKEVTQH
jgi:hypothetical protein